MGHLTSLHEEANRRANNKDRKWFNSHWGREFCARKVLSREIDGYVEYPGLPRQVIVAQIRPGIRMRVLVPLVLFDSDGNAIDLADAGDHELRDMFQRFATPERLAEYRAARARFAPGKGGVV